MSYSMFFFFFKQKTAYEMRISDWSSDVCSSDLPGNVQLYGDATPNVYRPSATVNGEIITATDIAQRMALIRIANNNVELPPEEVERLRNQVFSNLIDEKLQIQEAKAAEIKIGRASCRERVCQYV